MCNKRKRLTHRDSFIFGVLLGSGVLWGCSPAPEARDVQRHEAQARFLSLMKNGFEKKDYKEITSTFGKCFKKGDLASNYADLFATAQQENYSQETKELFDNLTKYYWDIPLPYDSKAVDSSQRSLCVNVTGNPQRIDKIYYSDSMD